MGEAFKLVFDPTKWGVRMLELEKNGILPALISYTVPYADMLTDTDGWDWIKIALRSFHVHFPGEKVLVVDNDMEDERYAGKRAWLNAHPDAIVIRNPVTRDLRFWNNHNPRDTIITVPGSTSRSPIVGGKGTHSCCTLNPTA